ncbi:MAG TPA: hypothetical protein VJ743_11080 [Albitalea sp.]|nr:hypothetical protein [Albitalea sp.]
MTLASLRLLPLLALAPLLPLLGGCLEKDKIATIPDAENQLFTPDGRLIVTGGNGVFEIKRPGNGFVAESISAEVSGSCNYTGLAQIGDWIFTACQQRPQGLLGPVDNHLLAARVVSGQPLRFVQVERASPDPMDALAIPNGMAVTPDGHLLIADFNLFMAAGVARVALDFGGARPRVASFEAQWLAGTHDIYHPNGVRVNGNELFVSDLNAVKRYQFDAAGNVPFALATPDGRSVRNEVLVYQGIDLLDDIQPQCGGLVISDYSGGRLVYMAPAGADSNGLPTYRMGSASGLGSLQQPSSTQIGRAPLFAGDDLLVTEKGVLGDLSSSYGNKLSRVKMGVDLGTAAGCAAINAM